MSGRHPADEPIDFVMGGQSIRIYPFENGYAEVHLCLEPDWLNDNLVNVGDVGHLILRIYDDEQMLVKVEGGWRPLTDDEIEIILGVAAEVFFEEYFELYKGLPTIRLC